MPAQTSHSAQRDFLDGCSSLSFLPSHDHVRFEQHAFEAYALLEKSVYRCLKDVAGHLFTAPDGVRSVHQDLRLDNGYKALLLAKCSVTRERVGIRTNASRGGKAIGNVDNGAPFGKTRTDLTVLLETVAQAIETFRDDFSRVACETFRAGIDLDA